MIEALVVSQILLWLALSMVIVVMIAMLRQLGVLFERVAPAGALAMNERLQAGDPAPEFNLQSLSGAPVHIGAKAGSAKSKLLFFLSTDCPVCKEILPAIHSLMHNERRSMDVIYVGSAQEDDHEKLSERHRLPLDNYVVSDELGRAFAVSKLPYASLIAKDGRVASFGIVNNREHLESLIEAEREGVASIQDYLRKTA